LESAIREAAGEQGLNLMLPASAFLLAKNTPQGWQLTSFSEFGPAFDRGDWLASQGNIDVYVLNSVNGGVASCTGDGQVVWL
jgi:hypothetical protein